MSTDAMFKLEHGEVDSGKAKSIIPTLNRLQDLQDRTLDDYSANRKLRDAFRVSQETSCFPFKNKQILKL